MKMKNKSTWELKNIVKALSGSVAMFLNSEKDNKILQDAKAELATRETK